MEKKLINKATKYIYDCRINNKKFYSIPFDCIPKNEEDSYLIQKNLHKMFDKTFKDKVIGMKIGCTTPIMQKYLNIKTPCAGRIRSKNCFSSYIQVPFDDFVKVGVECELAVSLSSDLYFKNQISDDYLYNTIDKVIAAIEIVDDRYYDWNSLGANQLIADDFFNSGCVLGDSISINKLKDLKKLEGIMYINNKTVGTGTGIDIMGNPIAALRWIIGRKDIIEDFLPRGSIVLLGSMVQTKWLHKGDEVKVLISEIGESSVRFF